MVFAVVGNEDRDSRTALTGFIGMFHEFSAFRSNGDRDYEKQRKRRFGSMATLLFYWISIGRSRAILKIITKNISHAVLLFTNRAV